MPTQSITLGSVSPQPLPVPGGQASVTFTYTGNYTGTVNIVATPVGGGAPVVVGAVTVSQTSGNHTYTRIVALNTAGLDPRVDYTFTATGGGVTSNPVGPVDVIPCFAAGTLIATAQGEVPVERLRAGDLVVTAQGGPALQPVVWMGHSRIDIARHHDPRRVAPVLIAAGALAEGMPHRPLRVSPDHGIHIEGVLVPAGLLLNGSTIVQELWCPEVTYWHVELPAHVLVVSDGAVTESYLDEGNRAQFDNHGITLLFKDFAAEGAKARRGARACLPVLTEGEALERIRARLAARAEAERGEETQRRRSA